MATYRYGLVWSFLAVIDPNSRKRCCVTLSPLSGRSLVIRKKTKFKDFFKKDRKVLKKGFKKWV